MASRDLRSEVGRSAADHAGHGQGAVTGRPRDTEVADPGTTVGTQEDVARLDVAMHDAEAVSGGQGPGHLRSDGRHLRRRQRARRALPRGIGESPRRHQLHHEAGSALVLDHIEDRHGVRVLEPRVDPRLPHGPRGDRSRFVVTQAGLKTQLLDRDPAMQALILGLPDHAHPARPELAHEAVAVADQDVRRRHRPSPLGWTSDVGEPARLLRQSSTLRHHGDPHGPRIEVGRGLRGGRPDEARLTELLTLAATTVPIRRRRPGACSSLRASAPSQVLSDGGAGGARTRDPGIMSPLL